MDTLTLPPVAWEAPPSSPIERPPARTRGGNRLPMGHPARAAAPGRYQRRRQFPLDYERRDRNQRERARRAARLAARRGELTATQYAALTALMDHSDRTLAGPIYPSLATLARDVHGPDRYDPDAAAAGARTAGRWVAELDALGWLHRIHRTRRQPDGTVHAQSNAYRVDIPEHLRAEVEALEDNARRSRAHTAPKGRPTAKRPGPTSRADEQAEHADRVAAARAAELERAEARRRGELPPCPGPCKDRLGQVEDAAGGWATCPTCSGTGDLPPP